MRTVSAFLSFVCFFHCAGSMAERFVRVYLPDGSFIAAELAVTIEERAQGLMFREIIGSRQGMLFVFEEEGRHSFWMKNTKISLDIIWLDRDKRIVHMECQVPPCEEEPCPSYAPRYPALYVLELKSGSVEEFGLNLFDRLEFILPRRP